MKSERRHHLQQNELAGHLGKARHWIEPYTAPLLVGIVVVIVGVILLGFFRSRAANQRSDATLGLLLSTAQEDAEAYNLVSRDFPGTAPAVIATLAKADAFSGEGIEAMFSDRELAQARLEDAVAAYRNVLDEATATTLLKSRAQYGLAQAFETQGDVDAAIDAYQQVIQLNESEAMVRVAEERIAALERPTTHEFVSWFEEQKPATFDPGTPPGMPDAGSVPDMPDFSLPGLSSSAADPAPTDADIPDGADVPADEAEEPVTEEPVTEEPVTEEPVTEEPVTEEPVTEEPVTEEPVTEEPGVETPSTEEAEDDPSDVEEVDAEEVGTGDDDATDSAENEQP